MENIARCIIIVICLSVANAFFKLKNVMALNTSQYNDANVQDLSSEAEMKISTVLDFKASYNGNFTLLEWRAEKDNNADIFIIEVSNDEENYEVIAEVNNFKNTHDFKNYTFVDNNNLLKDSFYRLRQTGSDGMVIYSSVVMVKVNPLNQLRLFPVPTKNILNIKGYFGQIDDIEVSISDAHGTSYPVYNLIKLADGHYTIDFSSLKPNNYFIKISSNGKSASFRILKL